MSENINLQNQREEGVGSQPQPHIGYMVSDSKTNN